MPAPREEMTVDFDHLQPVSERDPESRLAELRATCPMGWSERNGGFWFLTRYEDVKQALHDWRAFGSYEGGGIPAWGLPQGVPLDLDPPEHKIYRRLMNPLLSKEAVHETLLPRIRYWTEHYLNTVIETGTCDFIYDIGLPVPAAVTFEWIGWDRQEDWARISEGWHDLVSYPTGHPKLAQAIADIEWFYARIEEELDERARDPRDDLMTEVLNLEVDGEPIPRERASGFVRVAIAGGIDTTGTLVGLALEHLDRNPEDRKRLIDEPELWESATEEFLRRYSPVRGLARTVMEDVDWRGCPMRQGERVFVGLGSANMDDEAFPDPDRFILERSPNRHMGFGVGFHRCVGLHLARAEFIEMMSEVLRRMPDFRLDRDRIIPHVSQGDMSGWSALPGTFSPGETTSRYCDGAAALSASAYRMTSG